MNIRKLRISRDMSQKQLAISLGVSQAAVTSWQTGDKHPSHRNLYRMAEVFNVPMSVILSDEQIDNKKQPVENTLAMRTEADLRFSNLPEDVKLLALAYADGLLAMRSSKPIPNPSSAQVADENVRP